MKASKVTITFTDSRYDDSLSIKERIEAVRLMFSEGVLHQDSYMENMVVIVEDIELGD